MSYREYFDIDPEYFPQVDKKIIEEQPDLWKKFYPHPTFIKLLKSNVRNEFDVDKMEFRDYCLTPAMKMRRIIKLQQGMIDSEYKNKDVPCLMVRE